MLCTYLIKVPPDVKKMLLENAGKNWRN